ncbi:sulfatase family protein [Chitinophaga alhagiae]|uniref:sulfatase family protein n=1 Tax=Chitinophaga alhagiae TaxID=2203219 RepID=UPI000E5BE764|nr:sulfatase [Chitinophaga alhagiae]
MKNIFLLTLLLLASCCAYSQNKPNMVIFIADDLGAIDLPVYGNKVVRTPHIDQLRKGSMLFTQAFAASPTCGPSRSSLLTGLLPMRHGAHGNHSGVKEGTRSLVQYLAAQGYRVAIAGKLHIGPGSVFPLERIAGTNTVEPGFEKTPGLHYDLNLGPVDEWLGSAGHGKPFVLLVADHSPHVIWPETATYDTATADVPEFHINTPETRKARAKYYTDITKMDGNLGRLVELLGKHGLSQNTVLMFTADQGPQWAFGKWSLYDYGIKVPLLVKWPGVVKPGTQTDALVSLVDLLPTMVEIAGGTPPQGIDGLSFCAPLKKGTLKTHRQTVFASHTGDGMMNRTPMRMLRTTRYKYILNIAPDTLYTTHMDKARDHNGGREYWDSWRKAAFTAEHAAAVLYHYHHRPAEELYDLQADPSERRNLAADEGYAELMQQFRKDMEAARRQQHDTATGPEVIIRKAGPQKPVAPYVF